MSDSLLTFLKLLADSTRLNILGLLAQEPRSVDELAAMLDLSASTVSHHLTRLQKAGLVAAKAQQYYHIYALNPEAIQRHTAHLTPEHLAQRIHTSETVDEDAYTRQVLARWVHQDRLQGLPSQVQHRRTVLAWLVEKFEPDKRYDEDQVWELLEQWCIPADTTDVYRALVDANLLARLTDGSWYWRTDSPMVRTAESSTPDLLPIAETPDPNRYTPVRAAAKARCPDGVYANLKDKPSVHDPRRELVKLALRIKSGKHYTEAEIDEIIRPYSEGNPATIRTTLLSKGLLQQHDDGTYWRPPITPEHPAITSDED